VDALVAEMSSKEDSNFRLFGYVGEVNAEVEKLQARMQEVQADIDRWQGISAAQDAERARKLQVQHFACISRLCNSADGTSHLWP
jgi:hypothetical protein